MDSETERDFIPRKWHEHPRFIWILLFILVIVWALFGIFGKWESLITREKRKELPFFQVTKRDFSLFLYQNPEFLRAKRFKRFGTLARITSLDEVRFVPPKADEYIVAPPDILFRYHVWDRLLGDSLAPRPISGEEFKLFLKENPDWEPENWPGATEGYRQVVKDLGDSDLPLDKVPPEVQFAFQGWKNFFEEWTQIQEVKPTESEMEKFLADHPHYRRSYWRNILSEEYPDYLKNLDVLSAEDMPDFLKVGIYNFNPQQQTLLDK